MKTLLGKKFNKLTVIEEPVLYDSSHRKRHVVKCRCDCGQETLSDKYAVVSGRIRSCGCHREYSCRDLVGRRFGMLVVLERTRQQGSSGKNRYMARCQCDCGCTTETDVGALMRGATTSCGCRRDQYEKIRGNNSPQFTGHQQISGRDWYVLQRRAKRRNLKFDITIQYAWDIYQKQNGLCAFTGIPLRFGGWRKRPTASLDRIDNEEGYVEGNIQWVHKIVNTMRNIFSIGCFRQVCLLVARQQGWRPPEGAAMPDLELPEEVRLHAVRRF